MRQRMIDRNRRKGTTVNNPSEIVRLTNLSSVTSEKKMG
jgi:hypothetical protein